MLVILSGVIAGLIIALLVNKASSKDLLTIYISVCCGCAVLFFFNSGKSGSRSLILLKPDTLMRPDICHYIVSNLTHSGFKIVDAAKYEPSLHLENVMKLHYQDQVQYSHFNWLIDYMTIGPVVALAIEDGTNDCVNNLRAFVGSCNVPSYFESLRSSTQLSEWVNSAHSSSSRSEALRELSLWNLSSSFSTEDVISSNTICVQVQVPINKKYYILDNNIQKQQNSVDILRKSVAQWAHINPHAWDSLNTPSPLLDQYIPLLHDVADALKLSTSDERDATRLADILFKEILMNTHPQSYLFRGVLVLVPWSLMLFLIVKGKRLGTIEIFLLFCLAAAVVLCLMNFYYPVFVY